MKPKGEALVVARSALHLTPAPPITGTKQSQRSLAWEALPALLRPRKGKLRLCDYEKAFCADPLAGDIFDLRGIDRAAGCVVLVRPDHYVAHVLPLKATQDLEVFFDGFMTPVRPAVTPLPLRSIPVAN